MSVSTPRLTAEIREAFLKYFEKQGHQRVSSSSLIPERDPTLLFTNAGMNQFKDCFLGVDQRSYKRATSVQKCVRAGGKHNDLENVGFTARHHTFFEMLGNFSFGDYFKKDAIHFAWEFVTKELGLPRDKLRVSVFEKDDESAEIWHRQEGLPWDRIVRFGEADNFWSMGDTGPCGPCSEIFYDQGREVDGDRWLEFWNCVFMQFDRSPEGTLNPLPKPSVDTGMGLERMAAILQGVPSNYDIDLMKSLLGATQSLVEKRTRRKVGQVVDEQAALRVIVDHLRSTSFLIADGVLPSNEGRGYVLRRILRRAVRFGKRLGLEDPFLAELFPVLESAMGSVYPELPARASVIRDILEQEESRFFETLGRGLEILEQAFSRAGSSRQLPAEIVFRLYDTYGFPVDLTALIAREKQFSIDESGFQKLMSEQQERSRASWKGSGDSGFLEQVKEWKAQNIQPHFTGYEREEEKAKVLAVVSAREGAWVAIDPSPFYAEGGGQAGERGSLVVEGSDEVLRVEDTQRPYEGGQALYVAGARAATLLKPGVSVHAHVDHEEREASRANHTATHLLHAALREILGSHVAQAGSLVTPEKLRFDFSHPKALSAEQIQSVEDWVQKAIGAGVDLKAESLSYEEAIKKGALAFFSEKYGDVVRVVQVPRFSTELCGGLHVRRSSDIRLFKILSESAVAAGTRRIEAVTRLGALHWYQEREDLVERLARGLKVAPAQLEERIEKLVETQKQLEREIESLHRKAAQGSSVSGEQGEYRGIPLCVHVFAAEESKWLRDKGDALRTQQPDSIHILLAGAAILVTANSTQLSNFHAGEFLKALTGHFGGRGGGQAQTAQGQLESLAAGKEAAQILDWSRQASA